MSEFAVIRSYSTESEAQLASSVLEANGIPSVVLPDTAGGMMPNLAVLFPVRLAVRAEDAEIAVEILDTESDVDAASGDEWREGGTDDEGGPDHR